MPRIFHVLFLTSLTPLVAQSADPLVAASLYANKTVWSYHGDKEPLPWSEFKPRDYDSSKIVFDGNGVRPVGKVPAPGVQPRIFFSPEDLPGIRKRLKEDCGGQAAWKNILAWSNALKLTYDEKAATTRPSPPKPSRTSTSQGNMRRFP